MSDGAHDAAAVEAHDAGEEYDAGGEEEGAEQSVLELEREKHRKRYGTTGAQVRLAECTRQLPTHRGGGAESPKRSARAVLLHTERPCTTHLGRCLCFCRAEKFGTAYVDPAQRKDLRLEARRERFTRQGFATGIDLFTEARRGMCVSGGRRADAAGMLLCQEPARAPVPASCCAAPCWGAGLRPCLGLLLSPPQPRSSPSTLRPPCGMGHHRPSPPFHPPPSPTPQWVCATCPQNLIAGGAAKAGSARGAFWGAVGGAAVCASRARRGRGQAAGARRALWRAVSAQG